MVSKQISCDLNACSLTVSIHVALTMRKRKGKYVNAWELQAFKLKSMATSILFIQRGDT